MVSESYLLQQSQISGSRDQSEREDMVQQELQAAINKRCQDLMENEFETGFLGQDQDRFSLLVQQEVRSKKQEQPSIRHQIRTHVRFSEQDDIAVFDQQHLNVRSDTQDLTVPESQVAREQPHTMKQAIARSWQYRFNSAKGTYTCQICYMPYKYQPRILGHMSSFHKLSGLGSSRCTYDEIQKKHVCSICAKLYASNGEALDHIIDEHPKEVLHD